jgi:hypothetical protein
VLAGDFLDGLGGLTLAEVRARRHEAEQEEVDLSYLRRLLQGRADLIRAELAQRSNPTDERPLQERLAHVLGDGERRNHGRGRHIVVEPSRVDEHRRAAEALVADSSVSDVAGHSEDELRADLERITGVEREVSRNRHRVQVVMDTLTAEVGRRYAEGQVDLTEVLSRPTQG